MNKPERYISFAAAIISIFMFFTGIQSINHFFTKHEDAQVNNNHLKVERHIPEHIKRNDQDHFAVSALKSLLIVFAIIICFFASLLFVLIDLLLIFSGYNFPCLTYIWNDVLWDQLIIGWMWSRSTWLGAALACIIIIMGIIILILGQIPPSRGRIRS